MKILITVVIAMSAFAASVPASDSMTLHHCLDLQLDIGYASAGANNAVMTAYFDKVEVPDAGTAAIDCASSQFARFVPPALNMTTLAPHRHLQRALARLKNVV
ncbi:hypothetical protein EC957_006933 [Mortierella hygrophila]|uniref:Uncharacterized protein n=1 Tax=Mortierella hygrophila TaxID=979708 RepID=A0A9P6EYP7_9FUNG|nr:hypothetical protein EC957_006933 [Mortierella hygrophila]